MSEERIQAVRRGPPLSRMPLPEVPALQQDQLTIFEAAGRAVQLDTLFGQIGIEQRARRESGITGPGILRNVDPDYNMYRDEDLTPLLPYLDEIGVVSSHEEFLAEVARVRINNDLRHDLADYGVTRFFAGGFLDPLNYLPVPFALGKGFLQGAKTAMAVNFPLVVGSESARVTLDPTSEDIEVLYSTVGTMMFSGLIGGLTGSYKQIGKTTVSDAMNALFPVEQMREMRAEAGMFNWARYIGKGALGRIHRVLKSIVGMGDNKSDAWKGKLKVERQVDADGLDVVLVKLDGDEQPFATAIVRDGDTLEISTIELSASKQNQGIETSGYKELIRFAQEHGLKVVSDKKTSKAMAKTWEDLKAEGFNVKKNESSKWEPEPDSEMVLRPGDNRPNYELLPQLADQAKKIPAKEKEDWDEWTAHKKIVDASANRIAQRVKLLKEQLAAMPDNKGGRQTKKGEELDEALADLKQIAFEQRNVQGKLDDINVRMALMLDAQVAKDWDLLPTGYNKILANIDQFPFWVLMHSPLRHLLPEVGRMQQRYALRMASTPGLNTNGHVAGYTTGSSVEASAPIHSAGYVSATVESNRLYMKYLGFGDNTSGFSHYSVDQGQRVNGFLNKAREKAGLEEKPITPEGKMTRHEWDDQVTLAILNKGEHQNPDIAEAARAYIPWLNKIGKEAQGVEIYAVQSSLKKMIDRYKAQRDEAIEKIGEDGAKSDRWMEDLDIKIASMESRLEAYGQSNRFDDSDIGYIFRMWDRAGVIAKEKELKEYFTEVFTSNPLEGEVFIRIDDQVHRISLSDPIAIAARVEEAYNSVLKEARHGGDGEFVVTSTDSVDWLTRRHEVLTERLNEGAPEPTAKEGEPPVASTVKPVRIAEESFLGDVQVIKDAEELNEPDFIVVDDVTGEVIPSDRTERINALTVNPRLKKLSASPVASTVKPEGATKERIQIALELNTIKNKLERLAKGEKMSGGAAPLISRKLDLDDRRLWELGVIERSVTTWGQHYAKRIGPLIETARIFGDIRASKAIGEIHIAIKEAAMDARRAGDNQRSAALEKEAERSLEAMHDLRDIVQGTFGIPDDPFALTPRILRLLRNLNIPSAMGQSVKMAFNDVGNVVVAQGFTNTFRSLVRHWRRSLDPNGPIQMMANETMLAGNAVEVTMAIRYHQITEGAGGGAIPKTGSKFNAFEHWAAGTAQRFFLHNLMSPWTDTIRMVSGTMLQSRIIENAHAFRDNTISAENLKVMNRIGINKEVALLMLKEWENAGSLKWDTMYIANTEGWASEGLKREFRSAMNTEIGRMVPTPGAADRPKSLLSNEWWKIVGQYRSFSIGATHRIMSAGLQTHSASKYAGIASIIGIAMIVDAGKRPDYIKLPLEEIILRAVELSGVTGILLDANDTLERATSGGFGLRPTFGMDIRERDPNWSNRLGTIGAVPNQYLTLLYALTSENADSAHLTRAIRYMIPYNNLLWWNEYVNRMQRSTNDFLEED